MASPNKGRRSRQDAPGAGGSGSKRPTILYLSQDGITDHIGQAQIAPYLIGCARKGHRIHVISAEKAGRDALIARYRDVFDSVGISWSIVPFVSTPPLLSSVLMLRRMHIEAVRVMEAEKIGIIHCRSYLPFELGVRLKRRFGGKLLLDLREFWPDLRLQYAPFKFAYRFLKRREPTYFMAADHTVSIAHRAVDILLGWYPKAFPGGKEDFTVVPCCADFDLFDVDGIEPESIAQRRRELDLGDGPVLLYLGSLGSTYMLREMMQLFKELLRMHPSAVFLFVSNSKAEDVEGERRLADVPSQAIRFVSVERARVPEHIALADLSVLFITPTLGRAGCSPTKLAECFACNVPVIANTGVGDLDDIIDFRVNGSAIVQDFLPATLREALAKVLALPKDARRRIRSNSTAFSLDEAVDLYSSVYERLGSRVQNVKEAVL